MQNTAIEILKNKRSFEAEKKLLSIKKILELIPKILQFSYDKS